MPWNVLDIAPTRDEREIRRAYARLLKTRQHENNPAYFETLRRAYEHAIWLCRQEAEEVESLAVPEPACRHDTVSPEENAPADPPARESQPDPEPEREPDPELLAERAYREAQFVQLNDALRALDEAFAATGPRDAGATLSAWHVLREHPLLQRLDVREQASEVVADMIARRWPASAEVWPLAVQQFGWEPPTSHDQGPLADALRWLFDEHEGGEGRLEQLRDAYRSANPHPDTVLSRKENELRRHLRFGWSRGERNVMRRFVADIDALNLWRHFEHQAEALAWWQRALNTPRLSKRHMLPILIGLLPALTDPLQWKAWLPLLVCFAGVGLWHGGVLAWHRWRLTRGPLFNPAKAWVRLGSPALLTIGILINCLAAALQAPLLIFAGVALTAASAAWAWAWLAPRSRIRFMDDRELLRFGLTFLVVLAVFAACFRPVVDDGSDNTLALRVVFGCAMALWALVGAVPALQEYESLWPRLARVRIEYGIAAASVVLLVLHFYKANADAVQDVLCSLDVLLLLFGWACALQRDWAMRGNGFWVYVVSLTLVRAISTGVRGDGFAPPAMAAMLGVALFASVVEMMSPRGR